MANYHMASARNPDAPLDSEKLIFAVDLVHFVMATRWPNYADLPRNTNGCETYRDTIYNAFTGDIKDAVEFLTNRDSQAVDNRFTEYTQNNNEVSAESFKNFAAEYEKEYSVKESLNLRNLLKYFVSVALLAGHYHSRNITEAREIATNLIVLKLPRDYFENSEFWDKLNEIAREILGNKTVNEPVNLNLIDYQEHDFENTG